LAAAIGVSREWYAAIESAMAVRTSRRPSPKLLARVADALMVTPQERTTLFALALPEDVARLSDRTGAVIDAFSRMRSFVKQLYTATSIEGALVMGSEQIADWFDNAVFVHTSRRRDAGVWDPLHLDDKPYRSEITGVIQEVFEGLPSKAIDAANLYPQLPNAGDVGTGELQPLPLQQMLLKGCARRRLPVCTFLKARVHSRRGLISSFSVFHEHGHAYSPSDYAVLATFAEVASLALS
jgi:transcriptional regulator with XRE-family HTH domain